MESDWQKITVIQDIKEKKFEKNSSTKIPKVTCLVNHSVLCEFRKQKSQRASPRYKKNAILVRSG